VDVEEPLPDVRGPVGDRVDQPAHSGDERDDVVAGDAGVHRSGRGRARGELGDGLPELARGAGVGLALQEQVRVARVLGEGTAESAQ